MKTIFIGSINFSEQILKAFLGKDCTISCVITKKKSTFNSDFKDLSIIASKNKIPSFYSTDINSKKTISQIRLINPELIVCVGWSQILSNKILDIPKYGVIGYHPSKLPINRGRHPIIWSLVLGLSDIGSTFFMMDKLADNGEIISQKNIKILEIDNAKSLYEKLIKISKKQVADIKIQILRKKFTKIKQSRKNGNTLRKRTNADGIIDWRMDSTSIYNLIRALTSPYIGAHFIYMGKEIKVWRATKHTESNLNVEPGKVLVSNKSLVKIKCGIGSISLIDYEPRIKVLAGDYL